MTVICHDASRKVSAIYGDRCSADYVVTRDLLHADDTLLTEVDAEILQAHLDTIVEIGSQYGLELHWGKTCVLNVRHDGQISGPDGALKQEAEAIYLGGLLSADGKATRELTRRIGEAEGTFQKLSRVWRHANISRQRKQQIYEACVVSKLMYGLETTWLRKHERQRLDAYHIKCLRRIYGIAPSYYSRVSNAAVLQIADSKPMTSKLLQRQLLYFGKVARLDSSNLVRQALFQPATLTLATPTGRRARGRPRQRWGPNVYGHAVAAAGSKQRLEQILHTSAQTWADIVAGYCFRE